MKYKRILVIPDVHGRMFWKVPANKYLDSVDKIVFLGDYLDAYPHEDGLAPDIFENLTEIVKLKSQHPEKVILLKGNHDQHYCSLLSKELAGGSRMDEQHWKSYHDYFNKNKNLFQLAYMESINDTPYVFTHAGLTLFWLDKVNTDLWHLSHNEISITDSEIISRINLLDTSEEGQQLLSVIGINRSWFGELTGSVLWADIEEHALDKTPTTYGLDQVVQVFGHTKLVEGYDMIERDHLAMVDSRQCFMIDENAEKTIQTLKDYENI